MKRLILVGGLPGSGKSTFAEYLAQETGADWFEADSWFGKSGTYVFNAHELPQAHAQCQRDVEMVMQYGTNDTIVVSNTFSQQWERRPYVDLAKRYDYQVTEILMQTGLTDDELAARCVHGVPVATITKMRARWN